MRNNYSSLKCGINYSLVSAIIFKFNIFQKKKKKNFPYTSNNYKNKK